MAKIYLSATYKDLNPHRDMVWLPGGAFGMGQGDSPYDSEKPAHRVRLDTFSVGQYPVTFAEYDWEYACRGGNPGRYCFGDEEAKLDACAWYAKNADDKTHPVGTRNAPTPGTCTTCTAVSGNGAATGGGWR